MVAHVGGLSKGKIVAIVCGCVGLIVIIIGIILIVHFCRKKSSYAPINSLNTENESST